MAPAEAALTTDQEPEPKPAARKRAKPAPFVPPDREAIERHAAALGRDRQAVVHRAQDLMYDAWDAPTKARRLTLVRKALAVTPLCADAYNLLAQEARSHEDDLDLRSLATRAAELALGPEGFKEFRGHFWGVLETRPYMRAQHGMGLALMALERFAEAVEIFRGMLKLNRNDNQGVRYMLLAALLRGDDIAGAKKLLASYGRDGGTDWVYTRVLLAYRDGNAATPATGRLVRDALMTNGWVAGILCRRERPVFRDDGYITVGGPDEATDHVVHFGEAWRKTPGAVAWLESLAFPSAPPARRRTGGRPPRWEPPGGAPPGQTVH